MFWPFRKRAALPEASTTASERLAQLETDLRALRRDLDDLDDSFRSWRGREAKRAARASGDDDAPQLQLAPPATNGAPSLSVTTLRQNGKWPFAR